MKDDQCTCPFTFCWENVNDGLLELVKISRLKRWMLTRGTSQGYVWNRIRWNKTNSNGKKELRSCLDMLWYEQGSWVYFVSQILLVQCNRSILHMMFFLFGSKILTSNETNSSSMYNLNLPHVGFAYQI